MSEKNIELALRLLLEEGKVGTHEDIAHALKKQGFNTNQSKISRLLHAVGAVKIVDPEGRNSYRLPHEHGLMHEVSRSSKLPTIKQLIINISHNTSLIVIHTTPGAASLVAREVDLHHAKLQILGSIAGDDTIFVAPKDCKRTAHIAEQLKQILI